MHYVALILSFLFTALAGMFSAVMSSIDNRAHYEDSIFVKWNKMFWSKDEGWIRKYIDENPLMGFKKETVIKFKIRKKQFTIKLPFYLQGLSDGWHTCQSAMYVCFILAAFCVYLMPMPVFIYMRINWWWAWLPFLLIYGGVLVLVFNYCYNHAFKLKNA